jgi:hypothetical protein
MNAFRKIALLASGIGLVCVIAYTIALAAGARIINPVKTVYLSTTDRGDTAEVMKVTPSTGLDSFVYYDSVAPKTGGTKYRIAWTSPTWAIRLRVDSATTAAYLCSLYVNGTKRAFTFTQTSGATVAKAVDSFVAIINALAGVTDTVNAEDSGTYVYIRSLFSSAHTQIPPGRFYGVRGTTAARDLKIHFDTAFPPTTVAIAIDSLKKVGDTLTGLKDSIGFSDSTTFYTVYAKQKGLAFIVYGRDTTCHSTADTATLVANVASYSTKNDTIPLTSLIQDDWFCNSYNGWVILSKSPDTNSGVGDSTLVYMMLKTTQTRDSVVRYYTLDSTAGYNGACSLRVATIYAAANDTIFKEGLSLIVIQKDTTSDTNNYTTSRRLAVNLTLKNQ